MRNKKQQKLKAERRGSVRVFITIGLCILLFVAGFFLAGRQHFSSMDYGMKNSKLRKQIEDLESEKRRLILAREISMSAAEIRKAAKKVGLLDSVAVDGQVAQPIAATAKEKVDAPSTKAPSPNPLVIKTASVAETRPAVSPAVKTEKVDRPAKQTDTVAKVSRRTLAAE